MNDSIVGFSEDFLDAEDSRTEEEDMFESYRKTGELNRLDNKDLEAWDTDVTFYWSSRITRSWQ